MNKKQIKEIQEYIRSKDDFENWKLKWYDEVPKCRDFVCCHELMSCGIDILCGDCSILDTWKKRIKDPNVYTCTTVYCADCLKKYTCEKLKLDEENKCLRV